MASKKFVTEWIKNNCKYGINPHTLLTAIETDYLEDIAKRGQSNDFKKYCYQKITQIKNMKITLYKMNIYHGE